MTITINGAATASIGVISATICESSNYALNAATVSNNNGLLWITSGTGTFSNPAAVNPIYTPSAADITAGSVTLTLTANGNAPCGNATSTMTLNINKAPLANAGANASICSGSTYTISGASASNYLTILWTTSGTGALTNASTLAPTYTPGAGETGVVTLILTATPNTGCAAAAVSIMTITINGAATADAGMDTTICETSLLQLYTATATNYSTVNWTTNGTGTFSDPSIVNPIYTPSAFDIAAGTVTLTINVTSLNACSNISNDIVVTINRQPIVNAGVDATICGNSTYTLSDATSQYGSAILWTTSGTGTFNNPALLNPIYTPGAADITAGSVVLTIESYAATACANAIDSMRLTVNPIATAYAGMDTTIQCDSIVLLSGATAANYTSILWTTSGTGYFNNINSLNPVYTSSPTDMLAGTVILTLTVVGEDACSSASSTMTITILPCTPIQPAIGLAKAATSIVKLYDGSFNITYSILVQNLGNDFLSNVQVSDDLAATFPAPTTFNIVVPPYATGTLTANSTFDGVSDLYLLNSSASTLNIGNSDSIKFTVHVILKGGTITFYNTATGDATGTDGYYVSDISNDGYIPDPNGNGNAGDTLENKPTPVNLTYIPVFIPAGFSPNGDGNFDYFVIDGNDLYVIDLEVFNRWGNLVYKQDDYQDNWNGTSNRGINGDGVLPDGTYFYIVDLHNGEKPYVGYVTIKR
jgi:gliding motility-associated-like protein